MPYLMDEIASVAAEVAAARKTTDPVLSIFYDLTQRMRHAPRFLFDNPSIAAAVELTLGRPKILREAMAHVAVPYPRMWVEWDESGRDRIRREYDALGGLEVESEFRPLPARLGFLVEAETGGRSGMITWAWSSRQHPGIPPSIAPISAFFDLDADFEQEQVRIEGLLGGNLAKMWEGNKIQLDALFSVWRTAQHKPSKWGAKFLQHGCRSDDEFAFRIAHSFADVYGEYVGIWAVMMMLTASRKAVDMRPVDRFKLNKARAKKHQPLLLDHTEVVLHVDRGPAGSAIRRAPLGHGRKSPRIHMVSRYLARRGDKHWIVEPFLRGSGRAVERHVHVRRG
jgi:hypothetical protein